jgi:C4-dicarboxylate transporter DctM subunit
MSAGVLTVVLLGVLILLLGLGLRIAFCLGFIGAAGILTFLEPSVLYQIAEVAADTGTNIFLITLPLFILMAEVVSFSGVGDDMYTAAQDWLSWLPGGLAISSVATCAGFAAICGSSPATAATIGLVSVPEMIKRGYNKRLAVGSVSVGGTLGILIPPSITMIIYGLITESSIGKLFIAGIIPGILLSLILCAAIAIYVTLKPEMAPRIKGGASWKKRFASLNRIWAFVVLVISIMGSIYLGIATPEESAAVGTTVAIFIAVANGRLRWKELHGALRRTVAVTAMIMFMVLGGNVFAFLLSTMGIPQYITNLIVGMELSRWAIMIMINIVFLILGCLLDPMAIMVICLPILFPIVTKLGFDPIWFGIIVTINVEMGMITPPFGLNLFVLKASIKEVTMEDIVRGSLPFVLLLMVGLAVIMVFPILATWLPGKMGF